MRLQSKILLYFLFVALFSVGAMILLSKKALRSTVVQEVARRGLIKAEDMVDTLGRGFETRQERLLLPHLYAEQERTGAAYIMALDPEGRVLAHTNVAEKDKTYHDPVTREILALNRSGSRMVSFGGAPTVDVSVPVWAAAQGNAGEILLYSSGPVSEGRVRLGTLRLGLPLGEALETERKIFQKMAWIMVTVSCLAVVLALMLMRSILQPIRFLHAGTRRVGRGDYSVAVPVRSQDELGALADSFNKMSQALAETTVSKEFLNSILSNMLDALFVMNPDGTLQMVNRPTLEILGYQEEELSGKPARLLFAEEAFLFKESGLEALAAEGSVRNLELNFRTKAGTSVPVLFSCSMLRDADGRLNGIIGAARDITERKRQEVLRRQTEELGRSNKELERFAYSASHDLQEPLRTVSSYIQLLEKRYKGKLDPKADEFIHYVVDGVQRMQQLINDLLNYARAGGKIKPSDPLDCSIMVERVKLALHTVLSETSAQVTYEGLPTVSVDSRQFEQLLQNLISNAVKYHGRQPPRVHLTAVRENGDWVFSVQDNGIGISAENHARVFELFQRLHSRDDYPGSGIGLATCQKIVQAHGGRIWVESEEGKGSTFKFTLPDKNERSNDQNIVG